MSKELSHLLDYVAIRQLNARFNRVADLGDGKAYAETFTEDGELEIVGNGVYRGRAEIAAVAGSTNVTVHMTTEPEIEIDGDTARQRVRMLSACRAPDKSLNEFVTTGWYVDELRRTADGWRYRRRQVELDLDLQQAFAKITAAQTTKAAGAEG